MKALKNIIDTWNLIEKYEITGWVEEKNTIQIPETEYQRLLNAVKNKNYILNLRK